MIKSLFNGMTHIAKVIFKISLICAIVIIITPCLISGYLIYQHQTHKDIIEKLKFENQVLQQNVIQLNWKITKDLNKNESDLRIKEQIQKLKNELKYKEEEEKFNQRTYQYKTTILSNDIQSVHFQKELKIYEQLCSNYKTTNESLINQNAKYKSKIEELESKYNSSSEKAEKFKYTEIENIACKNNYNLLLSSYNQIKKDKAELADKYNNLSREYQRLKNYCSLNSNERIKTNNVHANNKIKSRKYW